MTNSDLLCKIKKLEKIEPESAWIVSNRAFILNYAQVQETQEKNLFFNKYGINLRGKINSIVAAFQQRFILRAASMAVIFIMAGNFAAVKAAGSLPGDSLYSVKLLMEKAELALTFDEDKRIALKFELIERRISEVSRLAESGEIADNSDSKTAMNIAVDGFKNQLNAVVSDMDNASKSGASSDKTVAAAKITNDKTTDYAKKIAQANIALGDKAGSGAKSKVAEAITKIEEANMNSLTVLVSANKQSGAGKEDSSSKEIAQKVEEQIKKIEEKTKLIQEKVLAVIGAKDGAAANGETNDSSASQLLENAKNVLTAAKEDLAGNDPSKALEKIIVSNEMAIVAEKMADNVIASGDITPEISPAPSPTPKPVIVAAPVPTPKPVIVATPAPTPVPTPEPSIEPVVTETPVPTVIE